ncbi:MAG: RagB/SusD family nutrient uptake outer membrane protein, partial [Bacteroidota bacterium]
MKNNVLILILIAAALLSCNNDLELAPEDQSTQDVAFSNETLARGVLMGAYSAAQQDDVLNGTPQLMGDWQSDNVDFVGSFPTFNDIKNYTILADNVSINAVWDDSYETIGTANLVIKNVPNVDDPDFTPEERANVIAQAKFLRALVYFNISNWWSQPLQVLDGGNNLSVPLVVEPFEGTVEYPSRATLSQVQAQIEQDLLEAIDDLDDSDRSLATQGAAQALLARLYLYQERWSEAAELADQVISKSEYELASDYTFYDTLSSEHIFTLVNNADDGQDSGQGFSGLTNPTPEG